MTRILFIIFCISTFFLSKSEAQEFSKTYSSNANTLFRKTIHSENLNCYFTLGEFGTGNQRVGIVTKLDLNGNILWAKKFNVASLVERIGEVIDPITKKSSIIISGSTFSGGNNLQVIKLDANNGTVLWSNNYSSLTYPHSIVVNNEVFLIGTNGNGVVVANLNPDGSIKWNNYYNSNNHELFFAGYPDVHSNGNIAFTFRAGSQFGVMAINPQGGVVFSKKSNVYRRFRNLSETKDGYIFSYVYSWENRNNNHGFIKIDTLGNLILNKRIYSSNPNMTSQFGEFSVTQTESNKIIYNAASGISGRYANNYFVFDLNGNLTQAYDSKIDSIYVEQLQNVPRGLVTLSGSSIQTSGCLSATTNGVLSIFKEDGSLCGLSPFNTLSVEDDPMILINTTVNFVNRNLTITPLSYATSDLILTPSLMCDDGTKLFNLGADIQQCNSNPITLNAGIGFKNYLWSTGAITSSIQVTSTNNYWVKITDECNRIFSDTIKVSISQPSTKSQTVRICQGKTYSIGSNNYTSAGIYTDTLANTAGCDSIVKTTLVVDPTYTIQQNFALCQGDSIKVGTKFYKSAGTFRETVQSVRGCDSLLITVVTIKPISTKSLSFSICQGESVKVGNSTYTSAGTFKDTLTAINGCDSIITTTLKVNPISTQNISRSICQGDSIKIGNQIFKNTGNYQVVLKSTFGCDSTVNLSLTVSAIIRQSQTINLCQGDSVRIGNNIYKTEGTYLDTLSTSSGCDSLLTTKIEILLTQSQNLSFNICSGASVKIGENVYTTSGIYTDTLQNTNGCDSIIIATINVQQATSNTNEYKICQGDSVLVNNQTYYQAGTFTDTLRSNIGCDSIYNTVNISIAPEITLNLGRDTTLCFDDYLTLGANIEAESYNWSNGSTQPTIEVQAPGTYTLTISNECRSVTDTITLEAIDCDCKVFIPNAFSPNGDGKNDVLLVKEENIIESKLMIYNKWGEEVFATKNNDQNWNGINRDKQLPPDVYGYYYEGTCVKGNKIEYKGNITIVR